MDENLNRTIAKIKSTMISCGLKNIKELHKQSILTLVYSSSNIEGSAHDLISHPTKVISLCYNNK